MSLALQVVRADKILSKILVSQLALKGRRLKRKELKSHLLDMTTPSYKGFSSSLNIALVPATSVNTLLKTHFETLPWL